MVRAFDMGCVQSHLKPGARDAMRRASGPASYFCASTASAMALAASCGVIFGLFTKEVMVSRIAPRYFCRMVMLWAIERTSVPSSIDACKVLQRQLLAGVESIEVDVDARAGIEPLA